MGRGVYERERDGVGMGLGSGMGMGVGLCVDLESVGDWAISRRLIEGTGWEIEGRCYGSTYGTGRQRWCRNGTGHYLEKLVWAGTITVVLITDLLRFLLETRFEILRMC